MAVAFVRNHTSGTSTSSGTVVTATTVAETPAGNTLIAWVAFDNLTATTPTVTSLHTPAWETNSWALLASCDAIDATAGTDVRGELWAITTTVTWSSIVSAVLSSAVTSKVMTLQEFSGLATIVRGAVGKSAGVGTASSIATSGTALVAGDLVFGASAWETEPGTDITGDSDTLNGSWSTSLIATADTGSSPTSVTAHAQYKIVTATGVQTHDTSSLFSRSFTACVVALSGPAAAATFAGWGIPL